MPMRKTKVPNPHKDVKYTVETHGRAVPQRIVVHSTESGDTKGIGDIEGVAAFWARQGKGYGSHFLIDAEGYLGQGARGDSICWHVASHNSGSIGIELIGRAKFSSRDWAKRPHQMRTLAKEIAFLTEYWDIPVKHSTVKGICMHRDFHGDHWDPGPFFPMKQLLEEVKAIRGFYGG